MFSVQSVHKQQQLQHQEFQRQMEERLELLQKQQPFSPPDVGSAESDYLEVTRARSDCSDHSSPNVTPRASNHSNMSMSEMGSSANEHEDGGKTDLYIRVCVLETGVVFHSLKFVFSEDDSNFVRVGNITFLPKHVLGHGAEGTIVYK